MRRRTSLALATVSALLLVALLSPARAAVSALFDRVGAPSKAPAAKAVVTAALPALTDEEKAQAVSVLASDRRAVRLLGGLQYRVAAIGVWHTVKAKKKLGASLVLVLSEPATIEGRWPEKAYDVSERTSPPYKEKSTWFTAAGVTELMVSVDLTRGKVVSISPGLNAKVTVPPGYEPDVPEKID